MLPRTVEGGDGRGGGGKESNGLRITFLANIWLNYQPSGLSEFPESELASLKMTPQQVHELSFDLVKRTQEDPVNLVYEAEAASGEDGSGTPCCCELKLHFGGRTGKDWQVVVPLPKTALSALPQGSSVHILWPGSGYGSTATKRSLSKRKQGQVGCSASAARNEACHQTNDTNDVARLQAGPGFERRPGLRG